MPGLSCPHVRARDEVIAAAIDTGDALERDRQAAILLGDDGHQLVDLLGRFRRRLDLHPAADAFEDGRGVECVGTRWHAGPCLRLKRSPRMRLTRAAQ